MTEQMTNAIKKDISSVIRRLNAKGKNNGKNI